MYLHRKRNILKLFLFFPSVSISLHLIPIKFETLKVAHNQLACSVAQKDPDWLGKGQQKKPTPKGKGKGKGKGRGLGLTAARKPAGKLKLVIVTVSSHKLVRYERPPPLFFYTSG
jgi:hypothetical protein